MYSILVRGSFCFNYCLNSEWHEVISVGGHCWGGMEAQVSLTVAFSSSTFFGLLFLVFRLKIPHTFSMGSGLVSLLASQNTNTMVILTNFWCFLQWWAGAKSCWKMKSASLKSWSAEEEAWSAPTFLGKLCSDIDFQKTKWTNTSRWHRIPNHHRLWKLNTGLQATWAMSFSTLPPDSRTLVSK